MQIFGHGIDIVDLTRPEFNDPNFAKRYMTKNEYNVCQTLKDEPFKLRNYMASIWSLKEAIIKALNHRLLFSEIEILFTSEAPQCLVNGYQLFLSVSFEKQYIIASAISIKKD